MTRGDGNKEVGSLIAMGMINKVLKKSRPESSAWLPETRWIKIIAIISRERVAGMDTSSTDNQEDR